MESLETWSECICYLSARMGPSFPTSFSCHMPWHVDPGNVNQRCVFTIIHNTPACVYHFIQKCRPFFFFKKKRLILIYNHTRMLHNFIFVFPCSLQVYNSSNEIHKRLWRVAALWRNFECYRLVPVRISGKRHQHICEYSFVSIPTE